MPGWVLTRTRLLDALARIPISLHCWQGDDVGGFENAGEATERRHCGDRQLSRQGAQRRRTAPRPGQGLSPDPRHASAEPARDLRRDRRQAGRAQRTAARAFFRLDRLGQGESSTAWISIRRCFSHPKAAERLYARRATTRASASSGSSTASPAARSASTLGSELGTPCVTNIWIPDGLQGYAGRSQDAARAAERVARCDLRRKDRSASTTSTRSKASCSASARKATSSARTSSTWAMPSPTTDAADAWTPGISIRPKTIADKLSAVLMFVDELLLHVSRGVRWDSDHVVTLTDDLQAIAQELVRGDYLNRVHIGLDYFDASINRIAAWVIGARNMLRALLLALVEPTDQLRHARNGRRLHGAPGAARRTQGYALWRGVGLLLLAAGRSGRHSVHGRNPRL